VATIELRRGYAVAIVALRTDEEEEAVRRSVSPRAAALLDAFAAVDGVRAVSVDVRNRHWAALVEEVVAALSRLR
jgi:hypothetical protein